MATKVRSKKAPSKNGQIRRANATDVMTLDEAAAYLRLGIPVVQRLALAGRLPGRFVESEWRFLQTALKGWLSGTDFPREKDSASPLTRREKLLSVAGCAADDETLDPMVEEIYRERKRHLVGDIQ